VKEDLTRLQQEIKMKLMERRVMSSSLKAVKGNIQRLRVFAGFHKIDLRSVSQKDALLFEVFGPFFLSETSLCANSQRNG
jgi:hypothetical protein